MKHLITPDANPVLPLAQLPDTDSVDTITLALLGSWRAQDATENPDELRATERELIEFKKAMDENRTRAGEFSIIREPDSLSRLRSSWPSDPSAAHRRRSGRYLPLTDEALRLAAELWAQ